MLQRLDLTLIPNFAGIQERFRVGRAHDPNSEYSVTKDWGTTGILWQPDRVVEAPQSWADFWALAPQYSGQIVVVEARDEVIAAALKLLGYSLNDQDPAHLAEAGEKLMELRPHVVIVTDYFEMFRQGTIVMGLGWSGDAALLSEALGVETSYTNPAEGSMLWEDDWCIPSLAPHPRNAHTFINYVLQPEVAAAECAYLAYATVVEAALPLLDTSTRNNPTIYPPPDVMSRLELASPATGEALRLRESIWAAFVEG
jgi:spermidine/putrescine-binding protein